MSISPTEIRIGKEDEWPFTIGSMSIILGIMAGIFAPGPWWVYWIIGVLGCVVTVWSLSKKDSRPIYEAKHIMKVQVEGLDRVGTKGTAGTVVGAAVGGIMFGGVGAIVGATAGGNKVNEYNTITIKFTDGEWATLSSVSGIVGELEYKNLLTLAGSKNECPI